MPTRSTGCHTCRKRKIRCDETRPSCMRCKTHGVHCPGYRTPAPGSVDFVDQTQDIVLQARKQAKKPSNTTTVTIRRLSSSPAGANSYSTLAPAVDLIEDGLLYHNETPLDSAAAMALFPMPTYLPSPAMEKSLIYSSFIDLYLPKRIGSNDAHFSFLQHLITTPNLRPEVSASIDALSMVQVGAIYKDKNLLRLATQSYSKALAGLVKTMSSSPTSYVTDDYVLATAKVLALCEFYEEIAQMGNGWVQHIKGVEHLLVARGPGNLKSELSMMMFCNMRHAALSHALIDRKACVLGSPEWRAVAWRPPFIDATTSFYDSALQLPGLLERQDNLDFASPTLLADVDGLLEGAKELEKELRDWHADFLVRSKYRDPTEQDLYWSTPIGNFPTYRSLVADRTVDEGYMFPSFMVAYLISTYWDVMHFLRTAIQKLHIARHYANKDWFPAEDEVVDEDELLEYVMHMCKCWPYFCEPVSSASGSVGIFLPMRTAAFYFMQRGNWKMLRWVGLIRENVFVKGMKPPSVRPANEASTPSSM